MDQPTGVRGAVGAGAPGSLVARAGAVVSSSGELVRPRRRFRPPERPYTRYIVSPMMIMSTTVSTNVMLIESRLASPSVLALIAMPSGSYSGW